jgi:thiol-disulfide isomerase/thioredoxin
MSSQKIWLIIVVMLFCTFADSAFANRAIDEINALVKQREIADMPTMPKTVSSEFIDPAVHKISANCVFVLFYRESCPHCRRFVPILKQYSHDSGIYIAPLTFDAASPLLPGSILVKPNIVKEYFGSNARISVPVLFIANVAKGQVYPVASGELSYAELASRMNELAPKILQVEGVQAGSAHG